MTAKKSPKATAKKKPAAKKPAAKKKAAAKPATKKADDGEASAAKTAQKGGAAVDAARILESEDRTKLIAEQGEKMVSGGATTATAAARIISEIATIKPEFVVPLVDKFVAGLTSKHKRVVQTSAEAMPVLARIAPARVARHLDTLKASYSNASAVGKDGLVRTFSGLCTASVAYQKRLEPSLTTALAEADGKTLLIWTQVVLPALKGEPHARARSVVEDRLYRIPRSVAQKIADFLGVRLRASFRG